MRVAVMAYNKSFEFAPLVLLTSQDAQTLARAEAKAVGRRSGCTVITLSEILMVRAKLVKIGNSRGIRLSTHPRAGWAESAVAYSPAGLLDGMTSTRFDDEEWSW